MEMRRLGRSDLMVSPLCFGGNVFGWTADAATSFSLLDRFVELGGNFIDTADVYSTWVPGNQGGESETIIGTWLKKRGGRDRLVIATKVGSDMGGGRKGLKPVYIRQAVEDSLRRLQTDHIDLYQSHRDDLETPQEATLEAYAKLIEQGKVRFVGASNFTAERLTEALRLADGTGLPRYESLQPEYNLYARQGYEETLEPICREQEVGVIGYFSLASGFLSGKYRSEADASLSPRGPNIVKKYLDARGKRILAALDAVARRRGGTMTQVALAWLMARPGVTSPIASATSIPQLDELVGAAALALDAESIAELDAASAWA
ncbi:aldo/keto reductase [Prosthecomicrobium sp. N25]|uniref:aldo/keto reductase n=1 Tax=Prosthecomicrobium sp. N25 TaxID=3129254 RepID=UPI00307750B1